MKYQERLVDLLKRSRDMAHRTRSPHFVTRARNFDRILRRHMLDRYLFGKLHWTDGLTNDYVSIMEGAIDQNLVFGAIDTEYNNDGSHALTEIGLSRIIENKVQSRHLRLGQRPIRGHKLFHHGTTEIIVGSDVKPIVEAFISSVDVLLFWQMNGDLKALRKHDVVVPRHKVLDLVFWDCENNGITGQQYSLLRFCEAMGYKDYHTPHNAGNDSHALLMAVKTRWGI